MADQSEASSPPEQPVQTVSLNIQLVVPTGMPITYANQTLVVRSPTEFVLAFFQVAPPFGQLPLQGGETINGYCVAQIALSLEQMEEFVAKATTSLQASLQKKGGGTP